MIKCPKCRGNKIIACDKCDGSGKIRNSSYIFGLSELTNLANNLVRCYRCKGTGNKQCDKCNGTGRYDDD
ncbi:MAG: DnaJ central domain [Chitinophagaceae bacterium]|nr:DnaJ central domain [Chitinophagaceae bacterium]